MKRIILLLALLLSACQSVNNLLQTNIYTHGLVVSVDNTVIDGADITNVDGGVCLKITGNNVTIRNSVIHDCKDHGVQFLGTGGGVFENNEIYRAAMRYQPDSVSSGWPSLFKVQSVDETASGLAQNIIIRNNYIHNGYGECMGLRGSYITVENNKVQDCYSIGIYSNSDHTLVQNNFVLCTGNAEFNRAGSPMVGIGFAEESFTNWGAHGHDTQMVVNNIVSGCKYGVRYGSSTNNKGLSNSVIAFNTLVSLNASISITSYSSQSNLLVENNLANRAVSVSSTGSTILGNKSTTATGQIPDAFKLTAPIPAVGPYQVSTDFGGNLRISPLDTGAWEFLDRVPVTFTPTVTITPTLTKTPTSTITPSITPTIVTPTSTPTPECHFFNNIQREVCIP